MISQQKSEEAKELNPIKGIEEITEEIKELKWRRKKCGDERWWK